jgi:hypothetical protein
MEKNSFAGLCLLKLEFQTARLLKQQQDLYIFSMTFRLGNKKLNCLIEHANLFGIEKEIESFSSWNLN